MNSEQWVMLVIIILIIFLLFSNQGCNRNRSPEKILSEKELEPFTAVPRNGGELFTPSASGILIQSSSSGQAIRVCGSSSSQATGLGKSANQVQIYTNGDPTAAFDATGLYNKGIVEATGSFRSTGDSHTAGSGGPGLELSYVSANDTCYATSINRTTSAFKPMNIQSSGFTVLCSPNATTTQVTPIDCSSTAITIGVPMTTSTMTTGNINNVKMWSNSGQSIVLNATHTSGGVYSGSGTANTGLGWNALSSTTTGGQNTGFGASSLNRNTTGVRNVAMGDNTLSYLTSGTDNVAIGTSALNSSVNGIGNIAIGASSLQNLNDVSGNYNTAVGISTLNTLTTGKNNEAFGSGALQVATSGYNNVSIGGNSLKTLTTGYNNVALGQSAATGVLTTGSNNVYLGASTVPSSATVSNETVIGAGTRGLGNGTLNIMNLIKVDNTLFNYTIGGTTTTDTLKGQYNVFMGNSAGISLTTGEQTCGFGQGALYSCTSGTYNSSFGTNSLLSLTTGNYNTGLGHYAGKNLTTGSNNVYIGRESVASSGTATNEIVIGGGSPSDTSGNWGKGSNTVSIGNSSTTNVYLNTTSGGTTVIGGGLQVGANASIYLTDTGGVTGASAYGRYFSAGGGLYQDFTTFFNWRSCGVNGVSNMLSCMSLDSAGNLSVTNAINNIKISGGASSQTVVLCTTSGTYSGSGLNTVIGHNAMAAATTGTYHTAVGLSALSSLIDGTGCSAFGLESLKLAKGSYNTAMGYSAGNGSGTCTGGGNEAFGAGALQVFTTGNNNSAIGSNSLKTLTTGSNNVALGQSAATGVLTTGTNNVYLGAYTVASSAAVTNEIAIGYGVTGLGSNTINIMNAIKYNTNSNSMSIGGTASAGAINGTYNVFMGNSAGNSMLTTSQQNTGIGQGALYACTTGSYNSAFGCNSGINCTTGYQNTFVGQAAGGVCTTGANNICIGYSTSSSNANVSNEYVIGISVSGRGTNTCYIGSTGGVYHGGNTSTWATTSDIRIKENINSLGDASSKLLALRPVTFNYIETKRGDTGFIAQEYQTVFPEHVSAIAPNQYESETLGLNEVLSVNPNLVPYLVKAFQEQQAQIRQLQEMVLSQQASIELLLQR